MFNAIACYAFGLCLTGAMLLTCLPVHAETRSGRVVWVSDGDTFTLRVGQQKQVVRIEGIDAPEYGQPGGEAARDHLRGLILYRTVTVSTTKRDPYGRHVAAVYRDKWDIGEAMIAAGHAWMFRRFEKELPPRRAQTYNAAELRAKQDKRGLWRSPDPLPPWAWRKQHREP